MRSTTNSLPIPGKRALLATILLALIVGTLSLAPSARAWFSFSVWYGSRTMTSVTAYWTVRPQEDSPSTPAELVMVCWTTHPTDYPCNSQSTIFGQFLPVGSTNSHTITGLSCSAYRVLVAQPYVVAGTGDWEAKIIDIPACTSPAAGPLLWLRADSIAQSWGSKVSFWADQSGNAKHASMATVARQPTFITGALNGLPVVRFGGAQSLALASTASPQQFTVFIVGKNSRTAETESMILGPGGSSPNNQLRWNNGSQALFVGNNGMPAITSAIGNTRVYHLLSARYNGSTMTVYRDNSLISSHTFTTSGPWTLAQVGAYYSSSFLIGDLAEILIYSSALSESDRSATANYLRTKYALP